MYNTQACCFLLLMCAANEGEFLASCSSKRANRVVYRASRHHVWMCLRTILGSEISQLPFSLGGLGLTSAVRSRVAAHCSSWADCIHMIKQRHPLVADTAVRNCQACWRKQGWRSHRGGRWLTHLLSGRRVRNLQNRRSVGFARHDAWKSNTKVQLWPTLTDPVRALKSRCVGIWSTDSVADQLSDQSRPTTISHVVVSTPLSPTPTVLSHLPIHHRAACCGNPCFPLERGCRDGRVGVDRFVRDLDLGAFNGLDQRRIEVIVDGLCGTEPSSQWTPFWCLLCVGMQQPRVVWFSGTFVRRRRGHTLNSQAREGGPGWLCWLK